MEAIQTHIVECNRANSVIDGDRNLGRWTTGCNLVLEPGDRVNVEACVINSTGASSGQTTMEFTGQNVVVQGEEKPYCDNHVVFEFGFYINNNNTNTIQLPIRQNMRYYAARPQLGPDVLNSVRTTGTVDTIPDVEIAAEHPETGWGTSTSTATPGTETTPGSQDGVLPVPLSVIQSGNNEFEVGNFPGQGLGFGTQNTSLFGYVRVANVTAGTVDNVITAGNQYNFIGVTSWSNSTYPGLNDTPNPGVYLGCNCGPDIVDPTYGYTWPPPVLRNPIPNGTCVQFWNFPLRPGMKLNINDQGGTPFTGEHLGIIKRLWIGTDPELANLVGGWTNIAFNTRLVIELEENFTITGGPYPMHTNIRGVVKIGNRPEDPGHNSKGRMGYGLINPSVAPDSYQNIGCSGYWHTENQTTYPTATGACMDYCRTRCLAGMALWERGRHYFGEWDYRNTTDPAPTTGSAFGGIQYYDVPTNFTNPPTGPGPILNKFSEMCPQYRSFGCSQPLMINSVGNNTIYKDYAFAGTKNSALGPSQWLSTNLRDNKDNAPYILVAPNYMGPQVLPDGSALAPEMRKLTCFVSIKIDESFTSAEDVAKQFTDAFHQANPFLKRSQISQKNTDRPSKLNTIKPVYKATPFINPNKSSRITVKCPDTAAQTSLSAGTTTRTGIPVIPQNAYGTNFEGPVNATLNRRALYDVVAPVYTGNLVKCIPCNLMPGINWDKQENAPYDYQPSDENDYLFSGVSGKAWCNLIYGAMAVKDYSKWSSGDLLCRLDCWDGALSGSAPIIMQNRAIPRPTILNTQFEIVTATIPNPINLSTMPYSDDEGVIGNWTLIAPIAPAMVSGNPWNGYPTANFGLGFDAPPLADAGWDFTAPADYFKQEATIPFTGTKLDQFQYIFTNINYTETNLDMLQRALRNNEKYSATLGQDRTTVQSQNNAPLNWYYDFDIGMANDEVGMNLRPEVCRTDSADELFGFYDYSSLGSFDDDHSVTAPLNGMAKYYANGSRVTFQTVGSTQGVPVYDFKKMDKANTFVNGLITPDWWSKAPTTAKYNSTTNPTGSQRFQHSVISPAQSYKGQGWETKYQSARGSGIVQCYSRWLNLPTPTPINKYYPLEGTTGTGVGFANCQVYKTDGTYLIDPTPSKVRNIGVVPYIYFDEEGGSHACCAFQVYRDYNPAGNAEEKGTQKWELACLQWGDFFGFSPSLLDNPAILPMNNDLPKTQGKDAYVGGVDSWNLNGNTAAWLTPLTGVSMTSQEEPFNKVNFTWVGSVNAGMNFNSATNRFELTGLNSPHTLSSIDQPEPPKVASGSTLPSAVDSGYENLAGVGTNVASYGTDVQSAQFGTDLEMYNKSVKLYEQDIEFNEYVTPVPAGAKWYSTGGQYNIRNDRYNDDTNQGKFDSQTGVFIENVFLAPEGWEPPVLEYGDLQNYWVPGTSNLNSMEEQREKIISQLTKADAENFEGSLLAKMGFTLNQLIPPYGEQDGDFNPVTNGSTNPQNMYGGTKPLILNSLSDVASNQVSNLFSAPFDANAPDSSTAAAYQGYPLLNANAQQFTGLPKFQQGSVNNQAVNLSNQIQGTLVAKKLPQLYASAYYLIMSDIVNTNFQSDMNGNVGNSNALFYAMKNYGAGDFYYSAGEEYWQVVTKKRVVTSITTEVRSPTTGKLATLGPNSVILYKIQRSVTLPDPRQILYEADRLMEEEEEEYERHEKNMK